MQVLPQPLPEPTARWYEQGKRDGAFLSLECFYVWPGQQRRARDELHVLLGRENIGKLGEGQVPDWRWHMSVAHRTRLPTWEELTSIAHRLRPGVVFCQPMPPKTWWLNLHPNTMHLWEVQDANLIEQWRRDARGDEPSGAREVERGRVL